MGTALRGAVSIVIPCRARAVDGHQANEPVAILGMGCRFSGAVNEPDDLWQHLAVRSLRSGECDLAVAGGVSVVCSPSIYVGFGQQRALSTCCWSRHRRSLRP